MADAAETDGGGGGEEAAARARRRRTKRPTEVPRVEGELSGNCKQPEGGGGGGRLLSVSARTLPTFRGSSASGADFSGKRARVSKEVGRGALHASERERGGGGGERGGERRSAWVGHREGSRLCVARVFCTVNAL